jgi:hypothetical protein
MRGNPSETIKLSEIKPNPNNPRVIKNDRFDKLVKSIQDFPKMLELRPMVVNEDNILLGGNMRLKALQHLKYTEIPSVWVRKAEDLTEDEQRQFIVKDNVGFGEWDWELLANSWDSEELSEWGLEVPIFMAEPNEDELIGEDKNKPPTMKITFESPEQLQKAEIDIQELLDRKYSGAYFSVSAGEI